MSALFRIVYAAHANGTHHKLALDALTEMPREDSEAWTRVFLKNVALYLEGSKAPDNSFKDFKNHVLHVSEEYWGGAPEKVEAWYAHTVDALKAEKWSDAAYNAGVLSHYFTDPIHPFHTGQTEAENAIHRACEWSINRSYDDLRALGLARFPETKFDLPTGDRWLSEFVCDNAEYAHGYYEKLIAHYDIHKGAVTPPDGLDDISKGVVAELLVYASRSFGQVLSRAIAESGVAAPDVGLTIETFLATLKIPSKWIEKRLSNAQDRQIVQAMYDELRATGRVEHSLPEDDKVIRDLHAREVLAPKLAERKAKREQRVPAGDPGDIRRQQRLAAAAKNPVAPAALAGDTALERAVAKSAKTAKQRPVQPPPAIPAKPQAKAPVAQAPAAQAPTPPKTASHNQERTSYLSANAPLEDAPSIGPKMAERFANLGISTVGEFLGQDPHDMAELLDDNRFDAETLTDWQDQAQLMIDVPGIRGTHAQLLVGSGYRTAHAMADADPVDLSADVLKFANTPDGKRLLREGNPPDVEKIKSWVDAAKAAMAA